MSIINLNLRQTWAYNGSNGSVTLPSNASFTQALAEYYGITAPVNGSWDYAIAEHLGITIGPNQSIIQKLAEHYGATEPVNGSWLWALAINATDGPVADLIWNLVQTEWQAETTIWNAGATPPTPTPVTIVEGTNDLVDAWRPDTNENYQNQIITTINVDNVWTTRLKSAGGSYFTAPNTNPITITLTGEIRRGQPDDPSKTFDVPQVRDEGSSTWIAPTTVTGWPSNPDRAVNYPYTLVWENITPSAAGAILGITIPNTPDAQYVATNAALTETITITTIQ